MGFIVSEATHTCMHAYMHRTPLTVLVKFTSPRLIDYHNLVVADNVPEPLLHHLSKIHIP